MKKLINKLRKRKDPPTPPSRITTETVAEHREQILAGGRKFKYPVQYARRKLVINAVIISVAAVIIAMAVGWWQLYPMQNTGEFMYRVTKFLPVPVAVVDGQPVLYSDYLMKYRSSVYYLVQKEQLNVKTTDGKRQIEYIKQQSLQDAIADAYALKLASKLGITVSTTELEGFIAQQRKDYGDITEKAYDASTLEFLGWSPSEYRHVTNNKLIRQKVAYSLDKDALNATNSVMGTLKADANTNFKTLAASVAGSTGLKVAYGTSGWVPKINQDGGLAAAASKLNKSQISAVIKSTIGNGYYVVRLLDINDTKVSYEYIHVPLTTFTKELDKIEKSSKVTRYISVQKS